MVFVRNAAIPKRMPYTLQNIQGRTNRLLHDFTSKDDKEKKEQVGFLRSGMRLAFREFLC